MGCGCPCGTLLAGTASWRARASGIRLRLALFMSSALGRFHPPRDWWSTATGYWHLVVNGDGHWSALDDGMWLSLWYPSGGYCLFEGVGDSSAAGSIYVQCLGAFSPAGGLVIDTHFMGYWHLVVNGDGHWNDLDDGMWLSLWYPSYGYCLFECVGDSSTARFLGVSWIRLTLAPSPCTVLMVITHAGGTCVL
ncbi:hypothetical protein CYMTET_40711 [Cymbomonas tetramitiformis]|uniref:Uncharacterized protein n=1 Tax=Cymbomonas tetramitiformis TaxID=36881 RepID=A0AAE0F396_9CHLO|nr:hypothetical protein CYMTET_40711 [Cymbomonas tetramitiformis]